MTHAPRPLGRPPRVQKQPFVEKPLYGLLMDKLPPAYKKESGVALDTAKIAADCSVTRMTVYRWFNDLAMSPASARNLIRISEGNLTDVDMVSYLLRA
jgi:hypothetical protein